MTEFTTRASSINRALDQVGDKWCLLIFQELLWGINTFNEMMLALGVSRGVLSNRLKWLESLDCIRREENGSARGRPRYHLTNKSAALYDCALMAMNWERRWYNTPELDQISLVHHNCGKSFTPKMVCASCDDVVCAAEVSFSPGPGASDDRRVKKVRRRSSVSIKELPSSRSLYRNLVHTVGDRWTANVVALAYHGLNRFEQFHRELPVATNILSDRLKFLVKEGIFEQQAYLQKPLRYEYRLTEKGQDLFPWFFGLLQWGDAWCDEEGLGQPLLVSHKPCGQPLISRVACSECAETLAPRDVGISVRSAGLTQVPRTAADAQPDGQNEQREDYQSERQEVQKRVGTNS